MYMSEKHKMRFCNVKLTSYLKGMHLQHVNKMRHDDTDRSMRKLSVRSMMMPDH